MNFEWIRPQGGEIMNSMQASVENGDQAICKSVLDSWPFGYLKDGSLLHFDGVDFNFLIMALFSLMRLSRTFIAILTTVLFS